MHIGVMRDKIGKPGCQKWCVYAVQSTLMIRVQGHNIILIVVYATVVVTL